MIIFDLDGTLADCEHRRHFVDPIKTSGNWQCIENNTGDKKWRTGEWYDKNDKPWQPDWKSFYEACNHDKPIEPVIEMWADQISLGSMYANQIWSGRCESVREKTEKWLTYHLVCFNPKQLKMRPIGDHTPDDQLKERWLDEAIAEGEKIDFVFDDRPKVIRMWRRRGIFVFNCCQHNNEF